MQNGPFYTPKTAVRAPGTARTATPSHHSILDAKAGHAGHTATAGAPNAMTRQGNRATACRDMPATGLFSVNLREIFVTLHDNN